MTQSITQTDTSPRAARQRPKSGQGLIWPLLLLPALLVLAASFVLPLGAMAVNSLHPGGGMGRIDPGWTLDNYRRFVTDPFFLGVLLRTLGIGLLVSLIAIVIAYPLAWRLARSRSRFRGALTFVVLAPLLISVVVRNLGWLPVLGETGFINWALIGAGVISTPLSLINNTTGVVIGLVHAFVPFMIVSLLAAIRGIDPALEDAAASLGAKSWGIFFRVILPLSRKGLITGTLLVFSLSISAFITPAMMGGRRVLMMPGLIEQQMRSVLNYPFGATIAVILLLVTAVAVILTLRIGRETA